MTQTIYLEPQFLSGGTVYGLPLGEVKATEATSQDVHVTLLDKTSVSVQNGIVTVTFPDGQVVRQSIDSAGLGDAKTVGSAMVAVGGVVAVIVPVGTVIGGIIAAAGALISLFANGKKAQKLAAERGQYEQVNAQLVDQNNQLDVKILSLANNIEKLKQDLGITKPSVNGLGFCLINCAKKKEQKLLNQAKDKYAQLVKDQESKISALQQMTEEVENLLLKKKNRTIVYIALGAALITGAGILLKKLL